MALEVVEARRLGSRHHVGVLVLAGGDEGHVHEGAVLLPHGPGEELGLVQEVVEDFRLFLVAFVHRLQAAVIKEVLEDLSAAVDGPAVGRVVEGVVVRVGLIAHIGGDKFRQVVPQQVLPDNDHRHARRAHVLLHAAPDEAVLAHVTGPGEEHAGLVGHQDLPLGIWQLEEGGAVDGLVFADIHIVRVVRDVQVRAVGDIGEVLVGGGGRDPDLAVLLRLGDGLLGPGSGLHVAGQPVFHQVHGRHGELDRAAALDEEDLVVVGNAHQLPQVRLRLVPDLLEYLAPVAHLHDAHAAPAAVHHLGGDLLQHGLRHHGGAGGEVVGAAVFHSAFLHSKFHNFRPLRGPFPSHSIQDFFTGINRLPKFFKKGVPFFPPLRLHSAQNPVYCIKNALRTGLHNRGCWMGGGFLRQTKKFPAGILTDFKGN